jgi:hypothetical protein
LTVGRKLAQALGAFVAIAIAGAESIRLGQDGNWDLQNYHYYNPHAFLNARMGWDVAPAMAQSYHNPLIDLPFYLMVGAGTPPRMISFLMAMTTGIAAFFLLRIALALFPRDKFPDRGLWVGLATAIGVLGAAGHAVIGSTMGEWPPAALLIAAISVLVSATARDKRPSMRALATVGLLAGLAVGLKLTYGIFGAALLVASASFGPPRERASRSFALAGFLLLGFLAAYGFWGVILQREFGNPFFPYFNGLFKSPYWEATGFFDNAYGPRDGLQALLFPFLFAWKSNLVGEVGFRDGRFAALYALAAACAVKYLLRRRSANTAGSFAMSPNERNAWWVVATFTLAAYLAWLASFGIFRYLVPLEMLTGPLIIGCALYLVPEGKARRPAIAILALLLIASTKHGNWGRLEYGERYFEAHVPALPRRALVILGPDQPLAHLVPFFPPDARFVSPSNNFLQPGQSNLLARRISAIVADHRGSIFTLEAQGGIEPGLRRFGLERDPAACAEVRSNLQRDTIRLCPARRRVS